MAGQLQFFGVLLQSWRNRLLVGVPTLAGGYQFLCDQFGFPTLPSLWGMTGAYLPWWGWLLLAQVALVYSLFEYVRRNAAVASVDVQTPANAPTFPPGETLVRLTEPERDRLSAALIAVHDYLTVDFAAILRPLQEHRDYTGTAREDGAVEYHSKLSMIIDEGYLGAHAKALKPYESEMLIAGISLDSLWAKSQPLWRVVEEISNVCKLVGPNSMDGGPLRDAIGRLGDALMPVEDEVDRLLQQITDLRLKICRGGL